MEVICGKCRGKGYTGDRDAGRTCTRCDGMQSFNSRYQVFDQDSKQYQEDIPHMLWEVAYYVTKKYADDMSQRWKKAAQVYGLLIRTGMGEAGLDYCTTTVPASRGYCSKHTGLTEDEVRGALRHLESLGLIETIEFKKIKYKRMQQWLYNKYLSKGKTPPRIVKIKLWPSLTPEEQFAEFDEEGDAE